MLDLTGNDVSVRGHAPQAGERGFAREMDIEAPVPLVACSQHDGCMSGGVSQIVCLAVVLSKHRPPYT